MRFLSLFSGIEAATVAWIPRGWECAAVAEIKPAACRVLAHHYPDVPNLGDVLKITEEDIALLGPIDLIVFGSPCQDLSLAGKRKGLAGERSGLFHVAIRIIGWARKHCGLRYALWENVPGAFSSNKGRDFAAVVGALAGCADPEPPKHGWGKEGAAVGDLGLVEWGVLDAQWFGVPQRRRRIFALADFGDWPNRPPVLLEPESLRGNSPPRRASQEAVAGTLDARTDGGGSPGTDGACGWHVVPHRQFGSGVAHTLRAEGYDASEDGTGRGTPLVVVGALTAAKGPRAHGGSGLATDKGAEAGHIIPVAFGGNNQSGPIDVATARNTHSGPHGRLDFESETFLTDGWRVRRLTPTECERLQAYPDGYTDVPQGNRPMADGPRYNMLGDSMATVVMAWIADQIDTAGLA